MRCSKCGIDKPEDDFGWSNIKLGKRQDICRACFSLYNKQRYQEKKEKIKADVKKYREENPEKVFQMRLAKALAEPSHKRAYKVVESALKAGVLVNPQKCSICGCEPPEHRIEAHHADYTKPLDVIWVCTPCHRALDAERREKEGKERFPSHPGFKTKILQKDSSGNVIGEFSTAREVFDVTGIGSEYMLRKACKQDKPYRGYYWVRVPAE